MDITQNTRKYVFLSLLSHFGDNGGARESRVFHEYNVPRLYYRIIRGTGFPVKFSDIAKSENYCQRIIFIINTVRATQWSSRGSDTVSICKFTPIAADTWCTRSFAATAST